jgi:hypothetical protein
MTNRTVQIIGYGFGDTPANVTATVSGTQVFSGNVPTVNPPIPPMPDRAVLFTFEIPMDLVGNIPMSVTIENSPVVFAQIYANYCNVVNVTIKEPPASNVVIYQSSGPTGFSPIEPPKESNSNFILDARSNVIIDGIDVTASLSERESSSKFGAWSYPVYPGSTMSCDIEVKAGLE